MRMGIGLSEILLILALIVVFVDSKKIPGLAGKCLKTVKQLRAAAKKYLDEVSR